MENQAIHYDGSVQISDENNMNSVATANESFEMTEEVRKNIGGNPFVLK